MPKVRIHLGNPLAFWGQRPMRPIMLDSVLGYVSMLSKGAAKTPAEIRTPAFPELPIEKEGPPGREWYRASAMFVPKEAEWQPGAFVRRPDWFGDFGHMKTNAMQSGAYRGYMEPLWYLVTPYVDFYFDGDTGAVAGLLQGLHRLGYLGSRRGGGHGRITRIELFRKSEDWAVWKDGLPTRPVPVDAAGEKDIPRDWQAYRPPYWHPENRTWCYVLPVEQWCPRVDIQKAISEF